MIHFTLSSGSEDIYYYYSICLRMEKILIHFNFNTCCYFTQKKKKIKCKFNCLYINFMEPTYKRNYNFSISKNIKIYKKKIILNRNKNVYYNIKWKQEQILRLKYISISQVNGILVTRQDL